MCRCNEKRNRHERGKRPPLQSDDRNHHLLVPPLLALCFFESASLRIRELLSITRRAPFNCCICALSRGACSAPARPHMHGRIMQQLIMHTIRRVHVRTWAFVTNLHVNSSPFDRQARSGCAIQWRRWTSRDPSRHVCFVEWRRGGGRLQRTVIIAIRITIIIIVIV